MMFGHVETLRERFEHLVKIRGTKPQAGTGQRFPSLSFPGRSGCRYPAGPDPGCTQPYLRRRIPAHDRTQPHHAAQCV